MILLGCTTVLKVLVSFSLNAIYCVAFQVILKEREEKKRIRLLDDTTYLGSGDVIVGDDVTENPEDCDVEESPDLSQDGQYDLPDHLITGACCDHHTYMTPLTIDTSSRMVHDSGADTRHSINVGGDGIEPACCMSPASSVGSNSNIAPFYKPIDPAIRDILCPHYLPLPGYGLDSDLTFSFDG